MMSSVRPIPSTGSSTDQWDRGGQQTFYDILYTPVTEGLFYSPVWYVCWYVCFFEEVLLWFKWPVNVL